MASFGALDEVARDIQLGRGGALIDGRCCPPTGEQVPAGRAAGGRLDRRTVLLNLPGNFLRRDTVQRQSPRRIAPAGKIGFAGKPDGMAAESMSWRVHDQNSYNCLRRLDDLLAQAGLVGQTAGRPALGDDERPHLGDGRRKAGRHLPAASGDSGGFRRMRVTALVPRPGTRSSASRSARFTSTGNMPRLRSAQASFGSMSRSSMPSARAVKDLRLREAIEAHQPVGLVEPVLAHQRRLLQRQRRRRIRDRAEGGIIDAAQMIAAVEPRAGVQDAGVRRRVGADDHLRRLAARREALRASLSAASARIFPRSSRAASPWTAGSSPASFPARAS